MKKDDILHVRIEKSLKKQLKREAKRRRVSMADLTATAIVNEVAR